MIILSLLIGQVDVVMKDLPAHDRRNGDPAVDAGLNGLIKDFYIVSSPILTLPSTVLRPTSCSRLEGKKQVETSFAPHRHQTLSLLQCLPPRLRWGQFHHLGWSVDCAWSTVQCMMQHLQAHRAKKKLAIVVLPSWLRKKWLHDPVWGLHLLLNSQSMHQEWTRGRHVTCREGIDVNDGWRKTGRGTVGSWKLQE